MSDRISTVVAADLEGTGDPDFKFIKKCAYCREDLKLTSAEWTDHILECEDSFIKRMEERQKTRAEVEIEKRFSDIEAIPTKQSTDFRGEQIIPWQQDSFIGIVVRSHTTRTESNIILPPDANDLTPELKDVMIKANLCRVIRVTDSFSKDAHGRLFWPRLAEVKRQIEEDGMLGPLVKFMPGAGQPFPDSEGRACVLIQNRYVYGEIEGSQEQPDAQGSDLFDSQADVTIRRGADINQDLEDALTN